MEIRCKIQGVQIRNSVTMNRVGIGWEVGERFKREGAYVYLCLIHVDTQQKQTKYCKTIILQLKLKKKHKYYCRILSRIFSQIPDMTTFGSFF